MSRLHNIATNADFGAGGYDGQLDDQLQAISDAELHHVIVINQVPQNDTWRKAGALARYELARRQQVASERLAHRTTWISAVVGAAAVVVGAILGALLS